MSGEKNLAKLLSTMTPVLSDDCYIFATLKPADLALIETLHPIGTFSEQEGMTVIVEQQRAEQANLSYHGLFKCISLTVHSSLEAVGLTAAVSSCLAAHNISANVVAAYYHDHIFVQAQDAAKALLALEALAAEHGS